MKTKWIIGLMAAATFASCGGDAKEEESTENKDTVTEVKDTVPAYEYKFAVSEETLPTRWWVYIGDSTNLAGLEGFFMKNTVTLADFSKKSKLAPSPLMAAYDGFSMDKKFYTRAGFQVSDSTLKVKGNLKLEKVNGGNAVKTVVNGKYEQLHDAWGDVMHYVEEKGLTPNGSGWEVYNVRYETEKDTAKWVTTIYLPVAPAAK
jgi:effector-binding domain-containing protein